MDFNPAALHTNLSHTKIMEWTNDDALQLIEQYRAHTELWNRADPKYKDKLCRFRAWSEIADRFGCSKAEVERKMNVLLTQYRREKHKMLVKLYQGVQPSPSKWYAFKRFDFMEVGGGGGGTSPLAGYTVGGGARAGGGNVVASGGGRSAGAAGRPSPGGPSPVGPSSGGPSPVAAAAVAAAAAANNSSLLQSSGGSNTSSSSSAISNGHHHHHHHLSHHHPNHAAAASAVAAAAALNGLAVSGYETAAAASCSTPTTAHHRRMKNREMKYFGAMGINIPMLLANSQHLDSWNPIGQFSPPTNSINERSQHLRVPLALPFPQRDLNAGGASSLAGAVGASCSRSLFGGSSNSDFASSPHKPMDTGENEVGEKPPASKPESAPSTPTHMQDTSIHSGDEPLGGGAHDNGATEHLAPSDVGDEDIGGDNDGHSVAHASGSASGEVSGNGNGIVAAMALGRRSNASGTETGSSPIPNTNNFEAHKSRPLLPGGMVGAGTARDQDDLDIKQELLENYFHQPHVPHSLVAPDLNRSCSSADDNRGHEPDDYAQDLRVSAAAAAAAKGLDFSRFVLPPNLRRSTDSMDDKFAPLNMRKHPAMGSSSNSAAGQMLITSLLSSESMSEDNNTSISGRHKSSNNPNGINGSPDATSSAAAAATAAAIYAESLNKDDCDFIGSNVSVKLRTMDRTQRIIAEKLIGEVLYFGQFNELERTARIQPK